MAAHPGCGSDSRRVAASAPAHASREVTIYDEGAAVVVDRRWVDLREGDNDLTLSDLPSTVDPDSIALRPLGGGAEVGERWFDRGAAAREVLAGAVGDEVDVARAGGAVRGRLVAADERTLLLDTRAGRLAVPLAEVTSVGVGGAAPAARPRLRAHVHADRPGRRLFELVYAAGALGFGVTYEIELVDPAAPAPRVRLRARARIDNRSGLELGGASVRLVDGVLADAGAGHPPLAFWSGRLGLRGGEARLVDAVDTSAPVAARYQAVYRGALADTVNPPGEPHHGTGSQPTVARNLLVPVPRGGPLGAVLPPGPAVVAFAAPPGGVVTRLLTALAARAAAGEEARFPLGLEPGLSGARRQVRVDRAPDLSRLTEVYEITVSNAGSVPVRVLVVEPLTRSPRVTVEASEPPATHDAEARELSWIVDVPAASERKITYTATYRF